MRLTHTRHQHPGLRGGGRSRDGFSQSFSRIDATGEQIFFVAFVPPETTNKTDQRVENEINQAAILLR